MLKIASFIVNLYPLDIDVYKLPDRLDSVGLNAVGVVGSCPRVTRLIAKATTVHLPCICSNYTGNTHLVIASGHHAREFQRTSDADVESPDHVAVRAPPAPAHAPAFTVFAPKTKKVSKTPVPYT